MEMDTFTIGRQRVHLRRWGSGTKVLVLHGWGSSSEPWEPLAQLLVKQGFEVIVPDLPGFGGSEPPKEVWGIDDYASFIQSFCTELRIAKCHVIAHSFGGRVALRLASTEAIGIDRLILCSSAGLRPSDLRSRLKRLVFYVLSKSGKAAARLPLLTGFQPAARRILYRGAGEHDYEKAPGVMKDVFIRVVSEDMAGDLPLVGVPTLLIWGENDRLTPIRDGRCMHRLLSGSSLYVIPGTGHNAYRDLPEETAACILKFLKEGR